MQTFYSNIIESSLLSADVCIPKTGHNKHNNVPFHNIPGRSEHLRQESLWWHHHGSDCGQPHNGNVAERHRKPGTII